MAYTAYEKMREINRARYACDGPEIPQSIDLVRIWEKDEAGRKKDKPSFVPVSDLERNAIEFIRENCEHLRFKKGKPYEDLKDYEGASLKEGQVPYNFQMDMDRRCLEVAIHRFLESGVAKDAFDVYFCYLEMFIGSYGKTRQMIEMLSEFETNASSLLMKHRDHYSHSVYVFLIGLALYQKSPRFREAYLDVYGELLEREGFDKDDAHDQAAHFLKYWGLAALFHDIGYPFELTFEQVKSYFGDTIDCVPFVTFNMNNFQNSKVGEVVEKAKRLQAEMAERSKLQSDADSWKAEGGSIKKYSKKAKELIEIIYGKDGAAQPDDLKAKYPAIQRMSKPKEGDNDILPSQRYQDAVDYLEHFIREIPRIREEGIEKMRRMMPADADAGRVEDFNVFMASALYAELGEAYAYYDEEKKQRFDAFDDFVGKSGHIKGDYKEYLYDVLCRKPEHPESFGGYIDHAYFSTIMLLNTLIQVVDKDVLNEMYTHSLTAILLHNSLYKFSITNYKKEEFNQGKHFSMYKHPLAYLLMLCDELQCWDRTSYGQNSRGEVHPFDCELTFGEDEITATYLFDAEQFADKRDEEGDAGDDGDKDKQSDKNYSLKAVYRDKKGTYKKLGEEDGKKCEFLSDIEQIVSINGDVSFGQESGITLSVGREFRQNKRFRNSYLSTSNFIHMYKFAILVHKMNHLSEGEGIDHRQMDGFEREFERMSLEYKINHISRAKKFSKILGEIDCFYSDKPMDCEIVTDFDADVLYGAMGPMEHERWCWEHYVMGWRHIESADLEKIYERKEVSERLKEHPEEKGRIRECIKLHPDLFQIEGEYRKEDGLKHFAQLDVAHGHTEDSKEKDVRAMRNLLRVLAREDGIKVYRLRDCVHSD